MSKKKSEEKTNEKTNTASAKEQAKEKLILFEAVQKNPTENYIIIGALSKADLLAQYRKEEAEYGIEDIEPSITMDELDKLIKKFLGE
ncbi:hypothetical protein [Methanobrevibacter sp.]|uniref:hypothetical protein n=1 Tax=Methanobrevibacter sp. TaxID=66852 RepID=UPI0025F620B8|nr:hypothetical protein [Methanobrevibacter sp.]MBQ6511765.1 hypothetical protein [Methanobrevibacter sp.]